LDRHQLVQAPACDDEAADMLREMAREADELMREVERPRDGGVLGIEAGLASMLDAEILAAPAPDDARQRRYHIGGKTERLADIADRRFRPIGDHRGGDAGAMPAVFAIDVLDHLLAP